MSEISVTVDNVVLSSKILNDREVSLYVLLVTRKNDPYAGQRAFPGGFVEPDEWLQQAAERELFEETGLRATAFQVMQARSDPKRDPRGRVITFPFLYVVEGCPPVKGQDDAASAEWVNIDTINLEAADALAFDHGGILREAIDSVADMTIVVNKLETAPEYAALMTLRRAGSAF